MRTNTKVLFCAIMKRLNVDCVCDIGSRDGVQSSLFKGLLSHAQIVAFEANPYNFARMKASPQLSATGIDLVPSAVSNRNGTAAFHVIDVNYDDPNENTGTSSLLVHVGLETKETVEVPVCRIDDFILERYPQSKCLGLWIDVEGAEYLVLEGMERIRDRVAVVHVETALTPMRIGQHAFAAVRELMSGFGFRLCGSNLGSGENWGDVLFVSEAARRELGMHFHLCQARAYMAQFVKVDHIAVFLKARMPGVYRFLRWLYVKIGT